LQDRSFATREHLRRVARVLSRAVGEPGGLVGHGRDDTNESGGASDVV
jgi:hypothetical protein